MNSIHIPQKVRVEKIEMEQKLKTSVEFKYSKLMNY